EALYIRIKTTPQRHFAGNERGREQPGRRECETRASRRAPCAPIDPVRPSKQRRQREAEWRVRERWPVERRLRVVGPVRREPERCANKARHDRERHKQR